MFHSPRLTWQVTFSGCAHFTWQDQFNLQKKGMTPVDMRLLITSLDAIEHVCMQEKSHTQCGKKASNKNKKGNKQPGSDATISESPIKLTLRNIATSAKSMGACILCTLQETVVSIRNMEEES
jgi:hypothetical protein